MLITNHVASNLKFGLDFCARSTGSIEHDAYPLRLFVSESKSLSSIEISPRSVKTERFPFDSLKGAVAIHVDQTYEKTTKIVRNS